MSDQPNFAAMPAGLAQERSLRGPTLLALAAFLLGAVAVGSLVYSGVAERLLPTRRAPLDSTVVAAASMTGAVTPGAQSHREGEHLKAVGDVESRLAMLEDRFSRIDNQASAASGNAARAESLLIAFAARRMIDRGEPLRYLADQLELRFSNAQPRAVRTIVEFARSPVTNDELNARLEALAPRLTGDSPEQSFWERALDDLSDMFTVRSEPSELISSQARLERARVMLRAGRVFEAIAEVKRLPGAEAAEIWLADAQRYGEVQHALDLIETVAMLEPSRLQDSEGNRVKQPSPLAVPVRPSGAE